MAVQKHSTMRLRPKESVIDAQLPLFEKRLRTVFADRAPARAEKLYRWSVKVVECGGTTELRVMGDSSPNGGSSIHSQALESLEVSTMKAVDRSGRRFRLLSPRSIESIADLQAGSARASINVTWHGWPYAWTARAGVQA